MPGITHVDLERADEDNIKRQLDDSPPAKRVDLNTGLPSQFGWNRTIDRLEPRLRGQAWPASGASTPTSSGGSTTISRRP